MNPRTRRQRKRRRAVERVLGERGWILIWPRQPIAVRLVSTRGARPGSIVRLIQSLGWRGRGRWIRIPLDPCEREAFAFAVNGALACVRRGLPC